jgi:Asp/Glu/hydantoin racemase
VHIPNAISMSDLKLLIINPNSSASITTALENVLRPHTPPQTTLHCFNPKSGPPGIHDATTATESTEASMSELVGPEARLDISIYDGILVCCFSEHPLISALSLYLEENDSNCVIIGMFHAGVAAALLTPAPFGIIATGTGDKPNLLAAVSSFVGCPTSKRFAGVITTGLQITELQDGDQARVEKEMKETTAKLVDQGAGTLILGCAGMSGMEVWVEEAAMLKGKKVRIVDGARVGVEMLVGMIRSQ